MEMLIKHYIKLLNRWNRHINLVQADSLKDVQHRHIDDCLQLVPYLPKSGTIFDIGSGAGFPGVILAIAGFNNLVLIEKDLKKAVFLKEVRRELNLSYDIYNDNVYHLDTRNYEKPFFAVSRAFSSLKTLVKIMDKLSIPEGLFHRGKNWRSELTQLDCQMPLQNYEVKVQNCETQVQGSNIIKSQLTNDSILLKIQCHYFK